MGEGLVQEGIELLACCLNGCHALLFQKSLKLLLNQPDPVDPGCARGVIGKGLKCPLKIVYNGQQADQKIGPGTGIGPLLLALKPLARIGQLGPSALPAIEVFRFFGPGLFQFLAKRRQFVNGLFGLCYAFFCLFHRRFSGHLLHCLLDVRLLFFTHASIPPMLRVLAVHHTDRGIGHSAAQPRSARWRWPGHRACASAP